MVSIQEFSNLDIRVGRIVDVQDHEKARKPIYKMRVDLGELGTRDIAAGIKDVYTKEELIGRLVVVVTNLDPKEIAGFVSQGMLLAAEDNGSISLLKPDRELAVGAKVH
ncbi:MAG: tRNA-binding protein [Candidatus Marsarchaeota archaeon]|nr:tRNA-binding protein [Candidatus Marsarchaeota archaeon]